MEKERKEYNVRIAIIKEEFNLSNSEVEGIMRFLTMPQINKRGRTFKDILEDIIKTDVLNDRQKVALAYSMGMFNMESNIAKTLIPIRDMPPDTSHDGDFGLMQGG